jgi:hypothetical protein
VRARSHALRHLHAMRAMSQVLLIKTMRRCEQAQQ